MLTCNIMFSKIFKKNRKNKNSNTSKDTFSINKMVENGKTYLLRFKNDQWKNAETHNYPFQMGIATRLYTDKNGFPNKEENEQLLNMELILEKEFSNENTAIFVGVIIGGGIKEYIFYTGKPDNAFNIFNKIKNDIKHHELQFAIREDPNWDMYKEYGPKK